jgi:hypothetical protein
MSMSGSPEGSSKRSYHTPVVVEFGSVSQTTATFGDYYGDSYIPPWFEEPQGTPGGDGGGGGGLS